MVLDKSKLSVKYVRLKDKFLNIGLSPIVRVSISPGVVIENVQYGTPKTRQNAVVIYKEDCKTVKKPVLIYTHGGGWVQGSNKLRTPYCSRFASLGFFAFNMNYVLAPDNKHPTQVRNIFTAIDYLYTIKDEYNLDMDNVFLAGDSAGAHLAALTACVTINKRLYEKFDIKFLNVEKFRPKGLILICGVYEYQSCSQVEDFHFIDLYLQSYTGYSWKSIEELEKICNTEDARDMCPHYLVNDQFPPCILLTGEKDSLHPTTDVFYQKLVEIGNKVRIYKGTGRFSIHCFPLFDRNTLGKEAMTEVLLFLKDNLSQEYLDAKDFNIINF